MPVIVTVDDLTTVESAPIITGTCDNDFSDIELTINGDVYKTRSLSGKWRIPTDPFTLKSSILIPEGAGDDAYGAEPMAVRLNDDRILLLYYKGGGHIGNGGRLLGQYSNTEGETWSTPFVVADHTSNFDTRNMSVYYNATDNRIALFYRTYNAATSTHDNNWVQYSTDYGQTWTAPTSITSLLPSLNPIFVPFGPVVETINGAMVNFYDASGNAAVLFSTDNGASWGTEKVMFTAQTDKNETTVIAVDSSRLVAVIRDSSQTDKFFYTKSSDGGYTWSAISAGFTYSTFVPVGASPLTGITIGDDVIVAFSPRKSGLNQGRITSCRVNKEVFWTNPEVAWSTTAELRKEEYYSDHLQALDFGYPRLLPILDGDYSALMWFYDQGSASDTADIIQQTISRI